MSKKEIAGLLAASWARNTFTPSTDTNMSCSQRRIAEAALWHTEIYINIDVA